jgi:FixJ family two-component response regulator
MTETEKLLVVVDDDASLRQALLRVLGAAGYSTRAFGSAEALLAAGLATQADCLVLDVRLPGQSGLALYAGLPEPRPPVVFISANDDAAQRRAAVQAGACDYLLKPFAGAALLAAVARATGSGVAAGRRGA